MDPKNPRSFRREIITRLTKHDLDILLTAAGRAPSGGNIQPWLVDVDNSQLTVKINPAKLGTVLDVNNYGTLYALGAFCKNLEIASAQQGLTYTQKLINSDDPNKFQIIFNYTGRQTAHPHPLYKAILARETNRRLHEGRTIPDSIFNLYPKMIIDSNPNFRLDAVSDNERKNKMATILGKADLIRTKNLTLLKQMMSEIRWTPKDAQSTKDGMDIRTMELPGNVDKMLHLLSKFASLAKTVPDIALEKQAWPLLKFSSHLCVLSFKGKPNPINYFQTGYIMQNLWLEVTNKKYTVHPWTVLSFFIIRAKFYSGSFFDQKEEALLLKSDAQLRHLIKLPPSFTPAFIFRFSSAKPASTRSLRYDWSKYTTIL